MNGPLEVHEISFLNNKVKFTAKGVNVDLNLVGFIRSDKSRLFKSITPLQMIQPEYFAFVARAMVVKDVDGFVIADTQYILRCFTKGQKFCLCLCVPKDPLFPNFDGRLYIKPLDVL